MMNVTESLLDDDAILTELNQREVYVRLPVRLFLGCVMTIGIVGNCHVLYIYGRYFKNSTYRNFVLSLSAIDMMGCCLSMPFEIADESNPYQFSDKIACKIFRYINTCVALSSGLTLVLVATERYRKICHPQGKQLSEQLSIYFIIATIVSSAILASPALHIYGLKTKYFSTSGIFGRECTWADHAQESSLGYAYFGTLVMVIVACMITLSVLYIFVGMKLRSHGQSMMERVRMKTVSQTNLDEKPKVNLTQKEGFGEKKERISKSCENLNSITSPTVLRERVANSCEILCECKQKETFPVRSNDCNYKSNDKHEHVDLLLKGKHRGEDLADDQTDEIRAENCPEVVEGDNKCSDPTNDSRCQKTQMLRQLEGENQINYEGNHLNNSASSKMHATCPENGINGMGAGDIKVSADDSRISSKLRFTNIIRLFRIENDESRRPSKDSVALKMIGKVKKLIKVDDRERRVTKVLFTITLLFIFSFMPYIVILLVYVFNPQYKDGMTSSQRVAYFIALRLYNINSAANSILYFLFDMKFRREVKNFYSRLWTRLRNTHRYHVSN